jgi:hypothetical protein
MDNVGNSLSTTTTTPTSIPSFFTTAVSDLSSTTSFEPVLNVPQLGAFLFIAGMFVMLQLRIRSIEQAAERRTIALDTLRTMKTQSLTSSSEGTTIITNDDIQNAIVEYRQRYNEVEQLREVLPGIRIVQPPSQTTTRQRMDDNIAGAQQFLGITPESTFQQEPRSTIATPTNNNNKALDDTEDTNTQQGLTIVQQAALAFILVTQCSLFCLLLFDPMSNIDPFFNSM